MLRDLITCFTEGAKWMLDPGLDKAFNMPAVRQKLLVTSEVSFFALISTTIR